MILVDLICSFPSLPVGWIKPDFLVLLLLLVTVDKEPFVTDGFVILAHAPYVAGFGSCNRFSVSNEIDCCCVKLTGHTVLT